MSQRKVAPPIVNSETAHFWDAASKGKFLIKRCGSCAEPHYYPRSICPFCFSDETSWEEASGEGEIYSFTVVRQASGSYVLAYVTLKEGPTIFTNILADNVDDLAIGRRVTVQFQPTDGGAPVPVFKLSGAQQNA
jgi:uncharacterized protein